MALLRINNLVKTYEDQTVLNDVSFEVKESEFLTLLGPSGCGKTTTLRILGGFIKPDGGHVTFAGEELTSLPPYERQINTVFQRYALFPHLNVYENIAFGLRIKKIDEKTIREKVERMLALVNLSGYEKRRTSQLSGGQQQRIAIARALVNEPKVLLLDEPLGALDLKLRKEMQMELKTMQRELGITFIYVTHDQEEALTMSDTIIVMKKGKIQQIGSPTDIYNEPENTFVADFIGESNLIDGVMVKDYYVEFAGQGLPCVDRGFEPLEPVDVVIRPEDIRITEASEANLRGDIESVVFKGVHYEIVVRENDRRWLVHTTEHWDVDQAVGLVIAPDAIHIMRKR